MSQSSFVKKIVDNVKPIPTSSDEFYADLVLRNVHFIDESTQKNLKKLKVLVAGCGAGGGACLEPLARVGVTHFRIADIGLYELSNMNRQHTFIDCIGMNKAKFHERELKRINPYIDIVAYPEGVTLENIPELVGWADIIFDCVDVTTQTAILLKLHLHEVAKNREKPVFAMLDVGFCQWGKGYDYRKSHVKILDGRYKAARAEKNPIKILLKMFPSSAFPAHTLHLIEELLENPSRPASQLGCAADLLSAVAVASVIRFAKDRVLIGGWDISIEKYASPLKERFKSVFLAPWRRFKIMKSLLKTS
jgi:hypothetical protein